MNSQILGFYYGIHINDIYEGVFYYMKYKEILDIEGCPSNSEALKKVGYRFVFDNMEGKSFIPVAVQSPKRIKNSKNNEKCSAYALSLFATEGAAKDFFLELYKRNPRIVKTLGDKLAMGEVEPSMGTCGRENRKQHFDFFEYEGCDLSTSFNIIGNLI